MNAPQALLSTLLCLGLCALSPPARAGHETDIANSLDNPFGFNLSVGYRRTLKRAAIKRELAGKAPGGGDQFGTTDGVDIVKDLRFSQVRQVLSVRAEALIVPNILDLMVHLEFPIVLSDTRELSFAQNGGDSCGVPPEKNCVTKNNSTLLRDRFLPDSVASAMSPDQVQIAGDTRAPNMFYLPKRSGIDQMYLGLSWAPLNQRRDPTKPTWVLGFEARIGIGEAMAYNPYFDGSKDEGPLNPKGNTSVGSGIHQYHWWTSISKRYKYVDPWMTFFYMLPDAKDSSLYEKTTFELSGQERSGPQQRGGVEAGVEIIPWEKPEERSKFSIELRARLEGAFEGRGYSEMWEIFANNPILKGPCRPSDTSAFPDKWNNGIYCDSPDSTIPFPGLTNIENYAIFHAAIAFNLDFTKYFRARLGVSLGHEQQHFITFGDAGRDIDDQKGITYTREDEVNPLFRPYVDQVGRRWRVGETTVFDFFVALEGRI
jgi:hypothetical protein